MSTAAPHRIAGVTQPAQTTADVVSPSSSGKVMIITLSMFVAIVVPTCSGVYCCWVKWCMCSQHYK